MERDASKASLWGHPAWPWIFGITVATAFSPTLLELAEHLVGHPWARTVIIFPWLAWLAGRVDRNQPRTVSRAVIWTSLGSALVIELLAVGGDVVRLGRVGLLIGGIGIVYGAGWARLPAAAVLVWAVPLPSAVLELASPGLETAWSSIASSVVPGVDVETLGDKRFLVGGDARLPLRASDGGLALAYGLGGLGWFRAVVEGADARAALLRALQWSLSALPFQLALLGVASAVLGSGIAVDRIRWILDEPGWFVVVGVGSVLAIQTLGQGDARHAGSERT